jgi:riboflavin kinase/FMN adenylyltransferase
VALNIGFRPTVAEKKGELRVEAHLLDFNCELYGRELEVQIGEKLRDERRFASAVELCGQIATDIRSVRDRI